MKEETRELPHSLTLENRTLLKAGGVLRIDSFDEETIAAATGGGRLLIRGENLHIEALDVDAGTLDGHRESDFFGVRRFREARRPFPPVPLINASAAENLRAFLAFCLLGAALGLLWSVLRGVRAHLSKKSALAVFLDAAFCVLAAFAVELCALSTYWGQVRAFHLFGAAAGFAAGRFDARAAG